MKGPPRVVYADNLDYNGNVLRLEPGQALDGEAADVTPLIHHASRVGYGAAMTHISAAWRCYLEKHGWPTGGEFAVGVCVGSLESLGFRSSLELLVAYEKLIKKG